ARADLAGVARRARSPRSPVRGRVAFWISLAVALGGWEAYVRVSGISPFFLVPPSAVAVRLGQWLASGRLFVDLGASLLLIGAGLGLAAAVAIPAGLSIGLWRGL